MRGHDIEGRGVDDEEDRDLVARLAVGDHDALRLIYERYSRTSYSLALRLLRQPQLAEETVQEVFLALWRRPGAYRADQGSVRTWLLAAVHHKAVDHVRRESSHRRRTLNEAIRSGGPGWDEDIADEVVRDIQSGEERLMVRDALEELPDAQREIVGLMYFDGLSQTQIATLLSLPLGTVKSRTALAMAKLRARLLRKVGATDPMREGS